MAAQLRRQRAAAKQALQRAATLYGELPIGRRAGAGIKFWATGPLDADVMLLLHAEDGETSAMWGFVHEALALAIAAGPAAPAAPAAPTSGSTSSAAGAAEGQAVASAAAPQSHTPSVCIVSFHRSGLPPHVPGTSRAPTLRAADAERLVKHLEALEPWWLEQTASAGQHADSSAAAAAAATATASTGRSNAGNGPAAASSDTSSSSRSSSNSSSSSSGSSSSSPRRKRTGPRDIVLVSHGEGSWGNLAFSAMYCEDADASAAAAAAAADVVGPAHAADPAMFPDGAPAGAPAASAAPAAATAAAAAAEPALRAIGSVLVAPALLHRGAAMAWWDGLAAASRVTAESSPKALDEALEPQAPEELVRAAEESARIAATARASGAAAGGSDRDGGRDSGAAGKKSSNDGMLPGAVRSFAERLGVSRRNDPAAIAKRTAEAFRRDVSKRPVISPLEGSMIRGLWERVYTFDALQAALAPGDQAIAHASTLDAAAITGRDSAAVFTDSPGADSSAAARVPTSSASGPGSLPAASTAQRPVPVAVVTHGFASLPPYMLPTERLAAQFWWLQGALAAGLMTAPPPTLRAAAAFRARNIADVVAELSGGESTASASAAMASAAAASSRHGAAARATAELARAAADATLSTGPGVASATGGSAMESGSSSVPSDAGSAGDNARKAAAVLQAQASFLSAPVDTLSLAALGGLALREKNGVMSGADKDSRLMQRLWRGVAEALHLRSQLGPDGSFTLLCADREIGLLSTGSHPSGTIAPLTSASLNSVPRTAEGAGVGTHLQTQENQTAASTATPSRPVGDFSVTLVQGPTPQTRQVLTGQLDVEESAATYDSVAHIPLQAPAAVAQEVLRVLGQASGAMFALPAQSDDATVLLHRAKYRNLRFYGSQTPPEALEKLSEQARLSSLPQPGWNSLR